MTPLRWRRLSIKHRFFIFHAQRNNLLGQRFQKTSLIITIMKRRKESLDLNKRTAVGYTLRK